MTECNENLREARIKCAAIQYQGKIYEGEAHCKIGHKMIADGVCKAPYPCCDAQGFVTEKGTFLSRYQALRVAAQAGQVVWGKTLHKDELFSEDLRHKELDIL
jgi:hypothetical protein